MCVCVKIKCTTFLKNTGDIPNSYTGRTLVYIMSTCAPRHMKV